MGRTNNTQRSRGLAWSRVAAAGLIGVFGVGCGEDKEASSDGPTWHKDIAPIVTPKCTGCHQEGGIAPFSMQSYATAERFASRMAAAVEDGRMPPFLAQDTDECTPPLPWRDDLRLSAAEKALIRAWSDAGAPEGDPATAPQLEQPPSQLLEREDVVMVTPEPITIEGDTDIHTCIVVDPQLDSDVYVVGRQITSGNNKVLHHVVSYVVAPRRVDVMNTPDDNSDDVLETKAELEARIMAAKGIGIGGRYDCFGGPGLTNVDDPSLSISTAILDAWAPGGVPNMAPEGSGQYVLKDSLVIMDTHYHPVGEPQIDDSTKLALMLATERPEYNARVALLGNFEGLRETQYGDGNLELQSGESIAEFMIPADAADHIEENTWTWKLPEGTELRVWSMGTHMHYVGVDMKITLEHADNSDTQCLIHTPQWDFNWQRGYAYDAAYEDLPVMRNGDTVRMRCTYDNTMDNPNVLIALDDQELDAPVEVRLGEDTLDEMCLGAFGIISPNTNP